MINMTLSALADEVTGLSFDQDAAFKGLSIDTRTLTPGNLFVAVIGEQFDGHDFVEAAFQKGAAAALVSRKLPCAIPQCQVHDTVEALGNIARAWRNRFSLPLIGVTGSNGKTTLKNMIASILRAACDNQEAHVFATAGNLNNHIGLPLTLSRLDSTHRYGVIEMGMNHLGEIAYLTTLAKPDIAVITNAAESHLEGVATVAGVAKAKGEIFLGLPPKGIAILNKDDAFFDYWCGLIPDHRYLTFGLNNAADVTATLHPNQSITLETPSGSIDVTLPLLGTHNVMNALAATAATLSLSIDLTAIKQGLENVQAAPGRCNQHTLPNGARIIDDTYNANPFSLQAAINALTQFEGKKIIILGDMRELGPDAKNLHALAGQNAKAAGIDYLFTLGELSKEATTQFGLHAAHFTDRDQLIAAVKPHLQNRNTILIKGSRSMRMEKILAALLPAAQLQDAH